MVHRGRVRRVRRGADGAREDARQPQEEIRRGRNRPPRRDALPHVLLVEEGKHVDRPPADGSAVTGGGQPFLGLDELRHREVDLVQVILAHRLQRPLPRGTDGREQQADQHADDGDD